MRHVDDCKAEGLLDGEEPFPEICSASRPAPNPWNMQDMNDELSYELRLLWYWALSRPVARIHLATMLERRLCRGIRATWTLLRMQVLSRHDTFGRRGCGAFPTEPTCAQCDTNWCRDCYDWSGVSCWKCYKPRQGFSDCGELPVATI